jgi:hypothetical protein
MFKSRPMPGGRPVRFDPASLRLGGSPRLEGEDEAYIKGLAELGGGLPPILVHGASLHVLDGIHRARAAIAGGDTGIEAVFFDGGVDAAFGGAARANIRHGLPLTLAERKAAEGRVLQPCSQWSDWAVSAAPGRSAATCVPSANGQLTALNSFATGSARTASGDRLTPSLSRRRAAEALAQRAEASIREVARRSGVPVGIVRDVRQRDGLDPGVPPRRGRNLPARQRSTFSNGSGRRVIDLVLGPPRVLWRRGYLAPADAWVLI